MATGLAIPIRVSPSGGFQTSSGDEHDLDIIMIALGSGENENAFQQDVTLGLSMIFDIADVEGRAVILSKLRRIFDKFERLKRFVLKEDTIQWRSGNDGETILYFKYVSLESDEEKEFSRKLLSSQAR